MDIQRLINRTLHQAQRTGPMLLVIGIAAGVGLYTMHYSSAETYATNSEAETGVVAGNASTNTTTGQGASGTGSVLFGQAGSGGGGLSLPLIPWEGGPAYYSQFPAAHAAGWDNPNFFPISMWYDNISTDQDAQVGKDYGINTYMGPGAAGPAYDANIYARNGVFSLDNASPAGAGHPGLFLADEVDCRTTPTEDLAYIRSLVANAPKDGTFSTMNFDHCSMEAWNNDPNKSFFEQMFSAIPGPVSVDAYWYTGAGCNVLPVALTPMDPGHCHTASSYGATVRQLRIRESADGHLQPLWNFIENLTGVGGGTGNIFIQPNQLKGAVMNSIISEARGIEYFNQDMSEDACRTGNAFRYAITGRSSCGMPQMTAMKEVNLQVQALAPIINTQSYQYSFGTNLDTMLKWYQGSAYIFAMVSGAASSQPGNRTFTLPPDLAGASSVTVVDENRTIPVTGGQFTDNFAQEYSYHIYKVTP